MNVNAIDCHDEISDGLESAKAMTELLRLAATSKEGELSAVDIAATAQIASDNLEKVDAAHQRLMELG